MENQSTIHYNFVPGRSSIQLRSSVNFNVLKWLYWPISISVALVYWGDLNADLLISQLSQIVQNFKRINRPTLHLYVLP